MQSPEELIEALGAMSAHAVEQVVSYEIRRGELVEVSERDVTARILR